MFYAVVAGLAGLPVETVQAKVPTGAGPVIAQLQERLDERLVDFPSARFKQVRIEIFPNGNGYLACGLVNSKNSAGGYTGWLLFDVQHMPGSDDVKIGEDKEFSIANVQIKGVCEQPGNRWLDGDFSSALTSHER